ncbi:Tellurite resistance protein TerB [Burkholderia sp. Leaf177]|uniref:tellurite resistance TerB family protein n=1 Tax=Burkholderia sp. Leaf177 TaxID=1736287 RepID=UPI0006FE5DDC|nr:TerB N-terminal domain-containing protein [Burkholderia sp. Leaf177]KQR73715.1 Tellurite resistance protein TerB [Burkholderia sp. Leaf177]
MGSSSGAYNDRDAYGNSDDETLVSVTIAENPDATGHSIKPPRNPSPSSVAWIPPGQTVDIGDVSISGGMFYFGSVHRSTPRSIEACVIDPRADLADMGANPVTALGSKELSYGTLTSEQRRTYLEWLGSDRKKSDIHTGYLFFYLYGLERRVLVDGAAGKVTEGEFEDIARELRRLLNIDANYSWQKHLRNLLESVGLMSSRNGKMYEKPAPRGMAIGYQVPMDVRVAFAQAAVDKHPVPAGWALAWAKMDPLLVRRAAVTRCPEEFDKVFARKYVERFKSGMLLSVNRTTLEVRPDPAFSALRNLPVPGFLVGLPDIGAINGPRGRLQSLMNDSASALDSYSRYLGRFPGTAGTLDATLMLPIELWPDVMQHALHVLKDELAQEEIRVSTFGEILGRFKFTGNVTRDKMTAFCTVLWKSGIAVEPDVRLGARTPKPGDALALFAASANADIPPADDAYSVATVLIDLAATVAMADGNASDAGISVIDKRIETGSELQEEFKLRLKARSRVQFAQRVSIAGFRKRIEALASKARQDLAALLVQVANADGVVSREKVKALEKVYRMMDMDTQQLYSALHQDGSSAKPAANFTLDPARIAALKHETARVSAILADVFVEEAHAAPALKTVEPEQAPLIGLDGAHSNFLRLLVTRDSWTRAELEEAASKLDLMLDGAIEQVNEAALDNWDEPLTDGDDPVEINQELAQRLAA